MRHASSAWVLLAASSALAGPLALSACKSNGGTAPLPPPAPCTDDPATYDQDPGPLPATNGQVLRCGHDGALTAAQVDSLARSAGYMGATLTSGASIVRLSYRTERGNDPPSPGFGGAVVLLPDAPRAAQLPIVVVAHGTIGEAANCATSRDPLTGTNTYLEELAYPLVGGGYAVIAPDYAGYAAYGEGGNSYPGYHDSADEAKSVLDAARALRAVQPSLFTAETVLVGHSQGGHAVLSALAMNDSYAKLSLAGVVAYAPSWFPMTTFGAILAEPDTYPLATNADTIAASVWYHYSHAELLDGPGSGALLFAADKRDAITQFFLQTCDPNEQALAALGTTSADLFDPSFVSSVSVAAALDLDCGPDPVCTKWLARYAADRPHVTGTALKTPILIPYGDSDEWIPAEREVCGFDRLAADGANDTVCIIAGATHDGAVNQRAAYVNEWIGALTLGEPAPGSCGEAAGALMNTADAGGGAVTCATPPPNE